MLYPALVTVNDVRELSRVGRLIGIEDTVDIEKYNVHAKPTSS
jgi:hypothetical protein